MGPSGYSGFDIELMNALAGELDRELVVANRILVIGLGLPIALGIRIPTTFGPGALALSLVVGAHMAETLRAGIEAVGRG